MHMVVWKHEGDIWTNDIKERHAFIINNTYEGIVVQYDHKTGKRVEM
jgi:hypothetical protein